MRHFGGDHPVFMNVTNNDKPNALSDLMPAFKLVEIKIWKCFFQKQLIDTHALIMYNERK